MASRKGRSGGRSTKSRRQSASVRAMSRATRPATPANVDDFYGGESGNHLKGEYHTERVYAWFQKRHKKGLSFIDADGVYRRNGHEWVVPLGVRFMLTQPLMPAQVAQKWPFLVTWRSPSTGKRLTKKMMSLPHAIVFVAERAQYVDSKACIINRLGVDIPPALRNKLPSPWKWCPRCMKPRKYRRLYTSTGEPQTFYATIKTQVGNHWEYPEKKIALMACPVCQATNRDSKFRRSNQPWHKTVVKRGRTRVKRRRK